MSVGITTSSPAGDRRDQLVDAGSCGASPRRRGRVRRDPSSLLTSSYPSSPSSAVDALASLRRRPRGRALRPARARRRAPRATASVAPTPTSASRGSQSRTSGSSESSSSGQDVGRVRDDEIPRPVREAGEQVPLAQLDREPRPHDVRAGDLERTGRGVHAGDARPGMLVRDRERDRAASRPDVEDARAGESCDPGEAALDDDLGLGPRHEHAPVDAQRRAGGSPTLRARTRAARAPRGARRGRSSVSSSSAESLREASSASSDRVAPSTCATRISASTEGDSHPAVASRLLVSASARATFTRRRTRPRAPGAAPRRGAPPSTRRGLRRAPGRDGAA